MIKIVRRNKISKIKKEDNQKVIPFVWEGFAESIKNIKEEKEEFIKFCIRQIEKRERWIKDQMIKSALIELEQEYESIDLVVALSYDITEMKALDKMKDALFALVLVEDSKFERKLKEMNEMKNEILDFKEIKIEKMMERLNEIIRFVSF